MLNQNLCLSVIRFLSLLLIFLEDGVLEDVLPKPDVAEERTPTGKIVGIIRRKWRQYCGILQENPLAYVGNCSVQVFHLSLRSTFVDFYF